MRQEQARNGLETPEATAVRQPIASMNEDTRLLDVLVVDDDAADMWLTVNAVRGDPRVRSVTTAAAPDEMLFRLARGDVRPHLILLDVRLPKADGFAFIDRLQEIPAMIRTTIFVLTTSRFSHDVERARQRSVRGFVVKPVTFDELRDRLSGVITQTLEEWR